MKFKNCGYVKKAYVSEKCFVSEKYDLLSVKPHFNPKAIIFSKTNLVGEERFGKILNHDTIATTNYIHYIKFDINCLNDEEVVFLIHNNRKNIKIWNNNKFLFSSNDWYSKFITKLIAGKNSILIEVHDLKTHRDFLISIYSINYKIPKYEFINFSDIIDIKEKYIMADKTIDEDGTIKFSVRNDSYRSEDDVKVIVAIQDFRIKYETKLTKIKEILVKIDEIKTINIRELLLVNNIKNKLDCLKIILYVSTKEIDDIKEIKNFKSVGFYFSFNNKIFSVLEDELKILISNFKYAWQKKIIELELNYIQNRNLNDNIKFFLLEQMYQRVKKIINYDKYIKYLQSCDYKEIFYKSMIDNQIYRFSINIPHGNKEYPLLMILASESNNAYISYFVKMFKSKYIIIECSTRGKHFGNYIAESAVLEVFDFVKTFLKFDKNKVFLFGHSSSGAVAASLVSKNPDIFSGCLVISSAWNRKYIKNSYDKRIVNICGELDENINDHYYNKSDFFSKSCSSVNVLIPYANDCTVSTFLKNETVINFFLSFDLKEKNSSYVIDNMYYNQYKNLEIIEKKDPLSDAIIRYRKSNINKFCLENVKIIVINPSKQPIIVKSVDYRKTYKLNSTLERVILNFSDCKNEKIISMELLESLNKLEILNMYHRGLAGVYRNKGKLKEINVISKMCKPQLLATSAKIQINYPLIKKRKDFLRKISKSNYVVINFSVEEYLSNFANEIESILCYDFGFVYKGKKYLGKYSIIQILPNFLYKNNFVTFINYNDSEYLTKNFFLRNIVLVSDNSVNFSVYRNVAIIYFNKEYFCIKKYGLEIEKLH